MVSHHRKWGTILFLGNDVVAVLIRVGLVIFAEKITTVHAYICIPDMMLP